MIAHENAAGFVVEPLALEMLQVAFPLVRQLVPGLQLGEWLSYARSFTRPGREANRGILAAYRPGRRFPCGLVCYHQERALQDGKVLVAEHFVSMDVLDSASGVRALSLRLEEIAREADCNAIHSILLGQSGPVACDLLGSGHSSGGVVLRKPVPARPGAEA